MTIQITRRRALRHHIDPSAVERRPHTTPDVSIVLVHYETPAVLDECLSSVAVACNDIASEVFVIDNASSQFSRAAVHDRIPGAVVRRNDRNLGFARAANLGLRAAAGRYVLLLNPDTVLAPDTIKLMVAYMDAHPDVGCATPRLALPDGSLDLACRRMFPTPARAFFRLSLLSRVFPKSRLFGQYNLTYLDEHAEAEIDSPCGAFMIVRSEVLEQVGLLDERYFMYGEDLDWSYRMKQAGWSIRYVPITTVTHIKRSSSRHSRPTTIRAFYDAMRIFYGRYYEQQNSRLVARLTYAAINTREAIEMSHERLTRNRHAA